jgi:hypothetical protein
MIDQLIRFHHGDGWGSWGGVCELWVGAVDSPVQEAGHYGAYRYFGDRCVDWRGYLVLLEYLIFHP